MWYLLSLWESYVRYVNRLFNFEPSILESLEELEVYFKFEEFEYFNRLENLTYKGKCIALKWRVWNFYDIENPSAEELTWLKTHIKELLAEKRTKKLRIDNIRNLFGSV